MSKKLRFYMVILQISIDVVVPLKTVALMVEYTMSLNQSNTYIFYSSSSTTRENSYLRNRRFLLHTRIIRVCSKKGEELYNDF